MVDYLSLECFQLCSRGYSTVLDCWIAVAVEKDRVLVSDERGGVWVSVLTRGSHAVLLLRSREELEGLVWRRLAGDGFCVVRADIGQVACGLDQFEVATLVVRFLLDSGFISNDAL